MVNPKSSLYKCKLLAITLAWLLDFERVVGWLGCTDAKVKYDTQKEFLLSAARL